MGTSFDESHMRLPFFERGLADDDNYHAFCRLLGHFKVNYQVALTTCSLNICIQQLLLCLMSSVWLNWFLLIGEIAAIILAVMQCFNFQFPVWKTCSNQEYF
nr:hypothetical protein CFP56_48131 [Quercus suber]